MNKYLAIDFGASSGRHIIGKLDNGKIITINIEKILSEKHRKWGEIITVEYDCEATVQGQYRRFLLEFTGNRLEWRLVKI